MKIKVDNAACVGHGRCNFTAPDLYELDEDGDCAITELEVPSGREADAEAGAQACPERAISILK